MLHQQRHVRLRPFITLLIPIIILHMTFWGPPACQFHLNTIA